MGRVLEFKPRTVGAFKKLNVEFEDPPKNPNATIAHYMTQEGQPYGSSRRCCNLCGRMVPQDGHDYTDNRAHYDALKSDRNYIRCQDLPKDKR